MPPGEREQQIDLQHGQTGGQANQERRSQAGRAAMLSPVEAERDPGRDGTKQADGNIHPTRRYRHGLLLRGILLLLDALVQKLDRLLRPARACNPELFPALLIVRDEEFFDLREQRLADIVDRLDIFVIVRMYGMPSWPIVSLFPLSSALFYFRSDRPASTFDLCGPGMLRARPSAPEYRGGSLAPSLTVEGMKSKSNAQHHVPFRQKATLFLKQVRVGTRNRTAGSFQEAFADTASLRLLWSSTIRLSAAQIGHVKTTLSSPLRFFGI